MILRPLIDSETQTRTWLLAHAASGQAVIVDPVRDNVERDAALIRELDLDLVASLETHVHADHVTGAWELRRRTGCAIVVPAATGITVADRTVADGEIVRFGELGLEARSTPGHTDGCTTWVTLDRTTAFTGDALLIRGCGRTDFQQGDARRLWASVHDRIFTLPDDTVLCPGHDYAGRVFSTVREERQHNPRLGGQRTVEAFVTIMAGLALPRPKQIDVAVPANLRVGAPEPLAWAPIARSAAGAPGVSIGWVRANPTAARLVDVRQPDEYTGPLGHIDGTSLVPMDALQEACSGWDRDAPVVLVCRSGARSDRAATWMEQQGFRAVASMIGGMIAWNQEKTP